MRARKTLAFLLIISFMIAGRVFSAVAQEWPTKPIEIYVGFLAGGPADLIARLYAPIMSKELGVPVVVINKPGATGSLCAEFVADSKPDGYTVMEIGWNIFAMRPHTHHTKFNVRSFTYILGHSELNYAFLVKKDASWKNFREWVEYARKNPGTKYGTFGAYSITHTVMEWICKREGIKVLHAPFQGDPDGFAALLGGHIDIFGGAGTHSPLVEAGKMRTLLQLSGEPADPIKVQYLTEIYPDFPRGLRLIFESPSGLSGPKGIPAPIVKKIAAALRKAMDDEVFKRFLKQQRRRPHVWEGEEGLANMEIASEAYAAMLKEIGFVKK